MSSSRSGAVTPTFNLADMFELVAARVPDREAAVMGDSRVTYGELDARSNRLAHHLAAAGFGAGDNIAIYSWNRPEWLEAMFAVFKLRAVPINVNYRYVPHELRYVLDDADVAGMVVERSFLPTLAELRPSLPLLRHVVVLEDGSDAAYGDGLRYEDVLAAADPSPLGVQRSGDDLYVVYTGGTTGMPKGVMWRQEDLFFAALGGGGYGAGEGAISEPGQIVDRIQPDESRTASMVIAPLMHGAANWGTLIGLLHGGKLVYNPARTLDAHAIWRAVESERCTGIMLVGDAMARPLAEALDEGSAGYDLSSLFSIGSGGAVFSDAVKDQLRAHLPNCFMIDTFGASELGASGHTAPGGQARRFTVREGMNVLGDDLRPVTPGSGEVGRLARSGHIPLGYYKDERKTAETFVTDPDGVRWAVPGDFATVEADGSVVLLGRGSQCINTGGEKVYPEEVEAALKSHPDVFDALVVGIPDERFTERVAAVVQPRAGRAPTLESLQEHCRGYVAGYKVPRQLQLVDEVSRTPAGKANYRWAKGLFETAAVQS